MASKAVAINGRFLSQRLSGVQRYAGELLSAWAASARIDAQVLVPRGAKLGAGAAPLREEFEIVPTGNLKGHVWEQTELRAAVGGDLLINLCNSAPFGRREQVVVIHDTAVWRYGDAYNWRFRALYKSLLPAIARTSLKVLTVSRFAASELYALLGLNRKDIEIVPNGADHILRAAADETIFERYGLESGRYALAVGNASPAKNIRFLEALGPLLSLHDLRLVVVGARDVPVFAQGSQDLNGCALAIGAVTDGELRALYQNALCLIFPSVYEGFGIPPVEAMICGCPVLSSNAASLPEVCGDAVQYFDPHDATSLVDAVTRFLDSQSLQDELRNAGRERAKTFTWARSAGLFNSIVDAC